MMILRNGKFILSKEMGDLKMVGKAYEVANITETAIVMRDADTKIAVCAVDIKNFDEYFERVEDSNKWTPWEKVVDRNGNTMAFYRTNQRKVQVRTPEGIRAESCCNKCDEFNLFFGLRLAMARCRIKQLNNVKEEYDTVVKHIDNDIDVTKSAIKNMINSLDINNTNG